MGFFGTKKMEQLRKDVNQLNLDSAEHLKSTLILKSEIDNLWIVVNSQAKFIDSIPQVKRCKGCANFKTDKKQFPICDLCSKNIFEVTTECQYTPQ